MGRGVLHAAELRARHISSQLTESSGPGHADQLACTQGEVRRENTSVGVGEAAQLMENSRRDVAATWRVEAGAATRRMANMRRGGPKEDDSRYQSLGITSTPNPEPTLIGREARRCLLNNWWIGARY